MDQESPQYTNLMQPTIKTPSYYLFSDTTIQNPVSRNSRFPIPFHHPRCFTCIISLAPDPFLAHLSRRLIGELIVYTCSGVRRRCCRCPPFSNVFSSETARPIKAKFYVELPWEGGTKVYINGLGHMTKMAAMPIYGKNLKNFLLQNQKSYDLKAWHVSLGTEALQSVYK